MLALRDEELGFGNWGNKLVSYAWISTTVVYQWLWPNIAGLFVQSSSF